MLQHKSSLSWLMLFGKGIVPPACHDPIASFLIIWTIAADATSNQVSFTISKPKVRYLKIAAKTKFKRKQYAPFAPRDQTAGRVEGVYSEIFEG
jgi:hypothetical protein